MLGTKQLAFIGVGATAVAGGGVGIYYSQQNKTTIRDKLASKNINLIETDEEYEISFKELKGDSEFITELKKNTSSIENGSSLQKGGEALKKWCETNLNLGSNKDNDTKVLPKVENYCIKRPTTIKTKYESSGRRLISNWQTKLTALKEEITRSSEGKDDTLVSDLEVRDNSGLDGTDVSNKLQKWCNDNIETKLNHTNADSIWTKVQKRCLEVQ